MAAAENAWAPATGRTAGCWSGTATGDGPLLRAMWAVRGWFELSVGSVAAAQPILVQAALDAAPVDPGQPAGSWAGATERRLEPTGAPAPT